MVASPYHMEGNIGEFGKSFVIRQTKTIQINTYIINNLLADLLIRQIFFHQMFKMSQFAKLSPGKLSLHMVCLLSSFHSSWRSWVKCWQRWKPTMQDPYWIKQNLLDFIMIVYIASYIARQFRLSQWCVFLLPRVSVMIFLMTLFLTIDDISASYMLYGYKKVPREKTYCAFMHDFTTNMIYCKWK